MNSEVINGIPFFLNEPKMALDFLIEKLGFIAHRHPFSKNLPSIMVYDNYGNSYEIFSVPRKNVNDQNDFQLVINTNDCLQDYYNFCQKGLRVLNRPHYIPEGLAFEILDPWGNKYTFLEKRDYSEL